MDLDQKAGPSPLHELGLGGPADYLDSSFGVDIHHGKAIGVQDFLKSGHHRDRRGFVPEPLNALQVIGSETAPQKGHGLGQPHDLCYKRLGFDLVYLGQLLGVEPGDRQPQDSQQQTDLLHHSSPSLRDEYCAVPHASIALGAK